MAEAEKNKNKAKIKTWYSNRYQIVVVQRNILLLFTLVSMLSVAVAVIFVKNIMSSKSLEPYVIEVEEKTGVATVVDQMTSHTFTGDRIIRQYFINQFVRAASGYDPKTYEFDSERVRLMSTANIYSDYRNRINARELGPESKIDLRIKSIQFPDPNTARVRLLRQFNIASSSSSSKDEVIDISFNFLDLNLTLEERLINPRLSDLQISDSRGNF